MAPGDLFLGRYRVLKRISDGGEATVYRAHDAIGGVEVALRFLRVNFGKGSPEVSPSAMMHPGWVRSIEEGFDTTEAPYQVFEWLDGETLRTKMQRGPMPLEEWLEFARQTLAAVEALHAADFVHGDLNADNFMTSGATPESWKLLELPFARFAPPVDRSNLFGSIYTLAPERLKGAPPGKPSDIYALGCLYYYAAAGVYPHHGGTNMEIVLQRLQSRPIPLHEARPEWPPELEAWVMALLVADPAERWSATTAARHLLDIA